MAPGKMPMASGGRRGWRRLCDNHQLTASSGGDNSEHAGRENDEQRDHLIKGGNREKQRLAERRIRIREEEQGRKLTEVIVSKPRKDNLTAEHVRVKEQATPHEYDVTTNMAQSLWDMTTV